LQPRSNFHQVVQETLPDASVVYIAAHTSAKQLYKSLF